VRVRLQAPARVQPERLRAKAPALPLVQVRVLVPAQLLVPARLLAPV
jgi:hypothetical protein